MNEHEQTEKMTVAIGADHAGYSLKEEVAEALRAAGYKIEDFGAFSLDPVDYPDIAREVAEAIAAGKYDRGILICGTGIGITIAANKVKGIRAGVCSEPYSAKMMRAHNNANILGMGSRVVGPGLAIDIAKAFLETEFEWKTRHECRVDKIIAIENS